MTVGPDAVHDDVGVALEQRHHPGEPVDDLPLLGRAENRSSRLTSPSPRTSVADPLEPVADHRGELATGRGRSAPTSFSISPWMWSRIQGTAVNCTRWVSSCRQTQSRKSVRVDAELALDVHDVGRDQQQPPAAGPPAGRRRTGRTGRAPCRTGSRAAPPTSSAGDPEPTASVDRGRGAAASPGSFSTSGPMTCAKPSALAWTQPARSTTSTGAVRSSATRPVNSRTSAGRAVGAGPQLGDDRVGLGAGDRRARAGEPGADGDREVPVDHRAS